MSQEERPTGKFCEGKSGGRGLIPPSQCVCTPRKKCQALKDKERFLEEYETLSTQYTSRKVILGILESQFEDSDWYKENVKY